MDVPELPTLSDLRIFGLSWPPPPAPPPPPPPPPPPAAREPKRQPASAAPATTADGETEGLSGGGESVTGTITGEIKTRGLTRRLPPWRRGRPKTDGGVGRTAAAAAAAVDSASEEEQDRPITKAGRRRKVGALAGLRKRLSLYGTHGGGGETSGRGHFEATSPVTAGAPASAGRRWGFARNGAGEGEPQPQKGRRGGIDAGGKSGGGGSTRSMQRKDKEPSVGLSAPGKLEPAVTPAGKSSSRTLTQQQLDRAGQALVDRRNGSPKTSPPPGGGGKDKGKKQAGSSMREKRKSAGPAGPPTSSKGQVAGRANAGEPPRGGGGGDKAVPEADKTSSKGERSVDNGGKTAAAAAAAAATAPTHFVPKFAPPPNAWKILSSKSPVEEPKASDQSGDRSPAAPPSSSSVTSGNVGAVGQDKWEGGSSEGSAADIDDDDGEEHDEFRDFGDLPLSVTSIPRPPDMEITINRSSGTPANAETRPAAAAAAKAAADSDNVLEEWVDGEPVEVHRGRMTSSWKPTRPDGLSGTSGEMKLVEMACLTGLSSRAGKSAGRIMLEELGFGHLLRGLRGDVRPSLQRRVLQAISTVIDSDPSLAPHLLGLDGLDHPDDDKTAKTKKKATPAGSSASAKKGVGGGSGSSSSVRGRLQERRRRQQRRRRRRRVAGAGDGSPSSPGPAVGEDNLLERITAILGYHMVAAAAGGSGGGAGGGTGFGVPGGVEVAVAPGGGDGPLGRAFRLAVGSLPLPRVRPFSSSTAAESMGFQQQRPPLEDAAVVGRGAGTREEGEGEGDYQVAREGRDWWKDEVALEEEGLEQQAATQAAAMFPGGRGGAGGSSGWVWWWGRGRRVSRERLVEEALELTFRLIMSGDAALDALKVDENLVSAIKRVAEGGGQKLQYDSRGVLKRAGPPLTHSQLLANKCLAALGAHQWRPKTRGQKGVRILCFDGGGTRGVLTLALLKHLEKALGGRQPHEVFDMIVGTSTGGIIAGLAGVKAFPVAECERMYDSLINKIFIKHPGGGMKLALKQAFYDEVGWMKILNSILGDMLMVDSAQDPLRPLIICPSTTISSNPARVMLWRNYNYPPGHQGRYHGSFRHMVRQAIRATTAAPTFFPPLMINGALYSDGALLCNNPSAVAFHEAKHAFPGVPIEMIVSIGTGCFFEEKREFLEPAGLGWDGIINQVIASATETEITTDIVSDLLPPEQFFRFNPRMTDMPIDEVRKERLDWLKTLANEYFETPENQARLQEMAEKMLPDP
ncbi:unnamed protein product [Ectocarpus sp. 6 AP-2014]